MRSKLQPIFRTAQLMRPLFAVKKLAITQQISKLFPVAKIAPHWNSTTEKIIVSYKRI